MGKIKRIILACVTTAVAFAGVACGEKTVDFEIDGASKITIFKGAGGRILEITDEAEIARITENVNELAFEKEKSAQGHDGFAYTVRWYGKENKQLEELCVMSETRVRYGDCFYNVTDGEIDVDFIHSLFYRCHTKPTETELAFWITEDVGQVDFSEYERRPVFMDGIEYFRKGYKEGDSEYVSYLVTPYPTYADGGSFVTRINVTDPNVKILGGLTITSTVAEWDRVLRGLDCDKPTIAETLDKGVEYKELWISGDEEISFTLIKGNKGYSMSIYVPVFIEKGLTE